MLFILEYILPFHFFFSLFVALTLLLSGFNVFFLLANKFVQNISKKIKAG